MTASMTSLLLLSMLPELWVDTFQLSVEEHIQSIEKELFTLHTCEQGKIVCIQAQEAHNPHAKHDMFISAPIDVPALATASVPVPIFASTFVPTPQD